MRQRKILKDVKVIGGEFEYKLLKVVLDRKWLKNARYNCAQKEHHTQGWERLK